MRYSERDTRLERRDETLLSTSLVSELLINEAIDRESNEMALKSIEPLSELEEILDSINKMPNTKAEIVKCIANIRDAINSQPSKILSTLRLSNSQKSLVDAITAGEVLKFSMLNAMDALRMSFISDFKKELADEVIFFNVVGQVSSMVLSNPGRAPFSKVSELGEYHTINRGKHFMIVGPKLTNPGGSIVMGVPTTSFGLRLDKVSPGPIYITGRDSEGNPAAVPDGIKKMFLGNIAIPNRKILETKIEDLLSSKYGGASPQPSHTEKIVKQNFRVPAPVEGMLTGIYRAIRKSKAVKPPGLDAKEFAKEIKDLTLGEFKRVFNAIVSKTEGAKGDFTTYDLADSLFLGGLAAVSGALGITRKSKASSPPAAAGSASAPAAGSGPSTLGSPQGRASRGAPSAPPANAPHHSLRNVLSNPMIAAGSTPAERSTNMSKISSALNQDELRRTLNSLTGGAIVFTEGTVDRWCELAGIKEGR